MKKYYTNSITVYCFILFSYYYFMNNCYDLYGNVFSPSNNDPYILLLY